AVVTAPYTSFPAVQRVQSLDELSSAMPLISPRSCFSSSSLSRRRFLALVSAAACSAAGLPPLGASGGGFDTYALAVHVVSVPVRGLPRLLEGLTIAHITDTHLGKLGRLEERVVTAVQAQARPWSSSLGTCSASEGHCQRWPNSVPRSRPPAAMSWQSAAIMMSQPKSLSLTSTNSIDVRASACWSMNTAYWTPASPSSARKIQLPSIMICASLCWGCRLRPCAFTSPMRLRSLIGSTDLLHSLLSA